VFAGFYRGKRVLITGVAGVKGTWLAQQLLELSSEVVGIDIREPEADSNFVASDLSQRITFYHGDVTDLSLLQRASQGVDCVFHLAAISLVGEARRNPLETYRSNTLGTATVLEAIRLSDSVQRAVFVTTDKVYRSKGGDVWVETDPLFATEPYPVSKACAEQVVADYYRNYLRAGGKHIGVARAGNVILGGDPYSSQRMRGAGHLHVDCFEALIEGRSPELYTPKFTRPYTYGLDTLSGYMTLMSQLDQEGIDGEAFNFGPHERFGVENGLVATKICQIWGSGIQWHSTKPREEPFEKQSLNWDKARQRLGWQPAYTIYEALSDIAQWYRAWVARGCGAHPGAMVEVNRTLIQTHQQTARHMGIAWAQES
jgi:CDP-glucose 4,6-dehydratase